jgi:hypothetical protein
LVRRSQPNGDPELLRQQLVGLLTTFAEELPKTELRPKVIALVPAFHKLRDLGSSLMSVADGRAAMDRVIAYFKRYPKTILDGDELMVVSGIGEWARRLRQLRKESGWWIYSGVTFKQMSEDEDAMADAEDVKQLLAVDPAKIRPDQYVLMRVDPDRDAAYRWHKLNQIRKRNASVKDKILEYFRLNVGQQITGEELKYLARDKKEWARRSRELRTEEGWPISTKSSGRPELPVGVYVLEEDRQSEPHDRGIPDPVRVEVLRRDGFKCVECGWTRDMLSAEDPRKMLELHHIQHHKDKGPNTAENLITLCNVHHDEVHR